MNQQIAFVSLLSLAAALTVPLAGASGTPQPIGTVAAQWSKDGQNFLPDLVGTNAVQPNQVIHGRMYYNNTGDLAGVGVTIRAMMANGFSFIPGSTRNCITPSNGEIVCNTDAGQAGPIPDSLWTAPNDLYISPTAGLYDVSPSQTHGILEIGKKRYLNFQDCDYQLNNRQNTDDILGFNPGNVAGSFTCGQGPGGPNGFHLRAEQSLFLPVDLLAKRYGNFQNCDYILNTGENTDDIYGFNPNNVRGTFTCGNGVPGQNGFTLRPAHSLFTTLDHLGLRYLNFQNCDYILTNGENTDDIVGFNPSNVAGSFTCGAGSAGTQLRPNHSLFLPLDLLDRSRGQGFIEFRVRVPNTPGITTQYLGMQGTNVAAVTDPSNIEVLGAGSPASSSSSSSSVSSASSVSNAPACSNGRDDDNDGAVDAQDIGCYTNGFYNPNDNDETNVASSSLSSSSSSSNNTFPACSNGRDDDNDGKVDYQDPGCYQNGFYNPNDNDEFDGTPPSSSSMSSSSAYPCTWLGTCPQSSASSAYSSHAPCGWTCMSSSSSSSMSSQQSSQNPCGWYGCPQSSSSRSSSLSSQCGGWCGWGFGNWFNANANANTTVNNHVNAAAQNNTAVQQQGGWWQNAAVTPAANTTVNNQVNAGSSNIVNGWLW